MFNNYCLIILIRPTKKNKTKHILSYIAIGIKSLPMTNSREKITIF